MKLSKLERVWLGVLQRQGELGVAIWPGSTDPNQVAVQSLADRGLLAEVPDLPEDVRRRFDLPARRMKLYVIKP